MLTPFVLSAFLAAPEHERVEVHSQNGSTQIVALDTDNQITAEIVLSVAADGLVHFNARLPNDHASFTTNGFPSRETVIRSKLYALKNQGFLELTAPGRFVLASRRPVKADQS